MISLPSSVMPTMGAHGLPCGFLSIANTCSRRPIWSSVPASCFSNAALSSSIRWLDPCGSGRFVVQHFNVVDQVANVFYTIEIRIRDFHGGEGLLHSPYLFERQQAGGGHDAPPIGPNALLRNQAIRSPVWRCFKTVRVLQERHCSQPAKKPCVTALARVPRASSGWLLPAACEASFHCNACVPSLAMRR